MVLPVHLVLDECPLGLDDGGLVLSQRALPVVREQGLQDLVEGPVDLLLNRT